MRWFPVAVLGLACAATVAHALEVEIVSPAPGRHEFHTGAPSPGEDGLGVVRPPDFVPCIPEGERVSIREEVAANRARLLADGVLQRRDALLPASVPALEWPLRASAKMDRDGSNAIVTAYVDHDPLYPNQVLDWNCGNRSYDLGTGYNHRGTDYWIWPFAWYRMDHDLMEVVAAAPGTIVLRADGNFDRSCGQAGDANKVQVVHDDGSMILYAHMKSGSVTPKGVGERVAAGEYLGIVGSSGTSTGPHLHLEVYDSSGKLVDPYFGACNSTNSASLWADQEPYRNSSILRVRSHSALPVFPACPEPEFLNERCDSILPGETLLFMTYYRDWVAGMPSYFRLLRPDTSVWMSWSYAPAATYRNVFYYATRTLPVSAETGAWWFEAKLGGQTVRWPFGVLKQITSVPLAGSPFDPRLRHWPNPSASSATIQFDLPGGQRASLAIYDLRGRRVRALPIRAGANGAGEATWDGFDDGGRRVAAGVYFYRLSGENFTRTRALTLLR